MIRPDPQGRVSSIDGKVFEEYVAWSLRHGIWIKGDGKWDAAYSRGPGTIPDTLAEIKISLNLRGRNPVNIRIIPEKDIFTNPGETIDNLPPEEIGRRLMLFEQRKMNENFASILRDHPEFQGMAENYHSEIIIAYGQSNGDLLITVEPYMPSAQVADQFVWLRDPDPRGGNIMAVLEKDYQQLYPDNVAELKTRRIFEWQIGESRGNLRYVPYNLDDRHKLESYTIKIPTEAAPSLDHYLNYRSKWGLEALRRDMKTGKFQPLEAVNGRGTMQTTLPPAKRSVSKKLNNKAGAKNSKNKSKKKSKSS